MIYVVLGMHKSGTTLVARALHESGIPMGQEFPKDADYSSVKYEARWAQEITDEILGLPRKCLSLEVTSRSLPERSVGEDVLARIRAKATELDGRYAAWGFKDPRAALTYRYWKDALPEHRVIVVYRDPVEVWRRYARVNKKWWSRRAFEVWADYNSSILEVVSRADGPGVLFLKFEDLLSGEAEWRRLSTFAEREIADVRVKGQSRFRVSDSQRHNLGYKLLQMAAGADARGIYEQLEALHRGERLAVRQN